MANQKDSFDINFDIQKAHKSTKIFSHATGVDCFVIDANGNKLDEASDRHPSMCNLCQYLQQLSCSTPLKCSSVHLYGSYQAERFGGKYIFFCPMGFVHWASPITISERFCGALIGGPVLMVDPDEFMLEDIIRSNGLSEADIVHLREHIGEVPIIQPDAVNNLAELLLIMAQNISDEVISRQEQKMQSEQLQSNISEWIHYIKTLDTKEKSFSAYPFEKEKYLLSKIALGDKHESQKILNEILGYVFFSSGNDFEVIRARILELIVLLSRAAVEGGANVEEIFGLNYKYLSQIYSYNSVEDLTHWLSRIMSRFTDCVFNLADVRHKDTIYKAVDYIKRNYIEQITLEDVAKHVYLNPSYFSKIFKNEMNCTFVSYVNKVRINFSKSLLMDKSIPLTDVSTLVGFDDQSYFTKVFKKEVGITPGKFRATRGQG